jgi:hypothetical protein
MLRAGATDDVEKKEHARISAMMAYRRILMRLNMTETPSIELANRLSDLMTIDSRVADQARVDAVILAARRVLRQEWAVTKYGMFTKPALAIKRCWRWCRGATPDNTQAEGSNDARRATIATMIIAGAAVVSLIAALLQYNVMRGQLQQMKTADARTQQQFEFDEWPYITVADVESAVPLTPTYNGPVAVNISFSNIGKSPASRVTAVSRLGYFTGEPGSADAKVENLFKSAQEQVTKERSATSAAPTQSSFMTTPDNVVLTPDDSGKLQANKAVLVSLGIITYEDVFKHQHQTEFCQFLDGSLTVWHHCRVHNTMR